MDLMPWIRFFAARLQEARMAAASSATIHPAEAGPIAQTITVRGIEIATRVLPVVGIDDPGHVVLRKRLSRHAWLPFIAKVPPLRIGMDACGSTHDWPGVFASMAMTCG
jgi:hypothetical protein